MELSSTLYHPSARRPISFSPIFLNPLSDEEVLILSRSNASRRRHKRNISDPSLVLDFVSLERDTASWTREREGTSTKEYINDRIPKKSERKEKVSSGQVDGMALIELRLKASVEQKRESTYFSVSEVVEVVSSTSHYSKEAQIPVQFPPSIPPKSRRRISSLGPALPIATAKSYTKQEWKQNLDTLKALFAKRYFKKCTTRCQELLLAAQQQVSFPPFPSQTFAYLHDLRLRFTHYTSSTSSSISGFVSTRTLAHYHDPL